MIAARDVPANDMKENAVDEATTVTKSVRGKFTRSFAAIGIGSVLAACLMGYAAAWVWSGSVGRELTELRGGLEGRLAEVTASVMIARQLDDLMRERIADVGSWALTPAVISAARQAHIAHEQSGLLRLTTEEIERRFQVRKSLGRFPVADSYLREEIFRSPYFERVLLTDRNGLNVVVPSASSDFVQSDEDWWQRAWSDGFALSPVKYDEGSGVWLIDICMRVDDPATEFPVGVIQAAVGISLIQDIADRYPGNGNGARVTVVNREGLLLAETSSEHSDARIMNNKVNVRDGRGDARQAVFGAEHSGGVADEGWTTGYSRTANGDFYADFSRGLRFDGFHWGVVVQSQAGGALAGIDAVTERLGAWHRHYALILGGGAVILVLLVGGIGRWMGGRTARPIRELRALAVDVSTGAAVGEVKLTTNDELSEIADAFNRMRSSLQVMIRMRRGKSGDTPPKSGGTPPRR